MDQKRSKLKRKPPSCWSFKSEHNEYGIYNFLHKKYGILEGEARELMTAFCEANNYIPDNPTASKRRRARAGMIQHHWGKFVEFVKDEMNKKT